MAKTQGMGSQVSISSVVLIYWQVIAVFKSFTLHNEILHLRLTILIKDKQLVGLQKGFFSPHLDKCGRLNLNDELKLKKLLFKRKEPVYL